MRYRSSPVSPLLLTLLLATPISAFGQEPDSQAAAKPQMDEMVVTGSHIARGNLDTVAPVMVFDSEVLKDAGVTTLGEFSHYLPQNITNASTAFSFKWDPAGGSQFNLRGIDEDGTLTLVNGRRVAPFGMSGPWGLYVDINAIPVAAIDRIEVLKDGASAIYGADAVAGVVNVILKEQVDGFTLDGGYLTTTEGDGEELDVNFTGGWSGRATRLTGTASYFDQKTIYTRDREWSSDLDFSDRGGDNNRSNWGSPATAELLATGALLADPECPADSEVSSLEVIVPGEVTLCKFNWAHFTMQRQALTRIGVTAALQHDFSGLISAFGELLFNRTESEDVAAPAPLWDIFVPESHPDNPFGEDLLLWYRALDAGNRAFDTTATTWRAVAGLRGFVSDWEWEAALMGSRGESETRNERALLLTPFRDALLGLGGPNGDQFYNPFGLNPQNDPAVIEQFISTGTKRVHTSEEFTFDGLIRGDFGSLPGGPVGLAVGFQLRHQAVDQRADEIEFSGDIAGSELFVPVGADRDIYSGFVEFMVPMHRTLEAQIAVRYDRYSDFGSTTNPKLGLGWRPVDGLLLRGTWGTSFRPPDFRQLLEPPSQFTIPLFYGDPHRCPVTEDFRDCGWLDVPAEFQGNPDLEPDEAETISFGLAWQPGFAAGLALSVDFWAIEHTNRIIPSWDPIWLDLLPPDDNPFVIRNPPTPADIAIGIPGTIAKLSDTYINADRLETNGVDVDVSYSLSTAAAGDFSATVNYVYLNKYETGQEFGDVLFQEDLAGSEFFLVGGLPKHRGNLNLDWSLGGHGAAALVSFAGDYQSGQNWIVGGEESDTPFIVDEYVQLDLQYRYTFAGLNGGALRLGCRNCTDEPPPVRNYPSSDSFHEGRGAMVYVRWTQPF